MRVIPECLRGVVTIRRYTNPRLPLPLPVQVSFFSDCDSNILYITYVPFYISRNALMASLCHSSENVIWCMNRAV